MFKKTGERRVQQTNSDLQPELREKLEERFSQNIIDKLKDLHKGWQVLELTGK